MDKRTEFLFLNIGHFYDHFFMLVFATIAALALSREWGLLYAELIPYATPGFVAFGVCALPAGWLADKWSRQGMMTIFFIGLGLSSIATAWASTPLQIGIGLSAIGVFAAIYHPVGLALVVRGRRNTGVALAVNGIFGNLGVACAALITGFLIDFQGWRSAFIWPGALSIMTGIIYARISYRGGANRTDGIYGRTTSNKTVETPSNGRFPFGRILAIIIISTALGGVVFQSTTFALPKVFDEILTELAASATLVGRYAFVVFAIAAFGQLAVGYLVDRYPVRYVFAFLTALQAFFFALMPGLEGWGALIVSIAFMLAVFGQIPINDVLVGRITRSRWRSRVYALRYIVTFSVMASSVPIIALIHKNHGFDTLFTILSVTASCTFLTVLMLPAKLPQKPKE